MIFLHLESFENKLFDLTLSGPLSVVRQARGRGRGGGGPDAKNQG